MERDQWAKLMAARLSNEYKNILKNWPKLDLEIWLRDGCRCVYCDRDMLHDRHIAYCFYNYDHVLPVKKYPALENASWNKVLTCRACNSWKATFDPAESDSQATEAHRDKLIERARAYIQAQRKPAEVLFQQELQVISAALRGSFDSQRAVHA